MTDQGDEPPPFPANPAPYLTGWLFELVGDEAISWQELAAWERLSGVELLPWEAKILRTLSVQYVNEKYRATKADRPMPYNMAKKEIEARRDNVESKVRGLFANLVGKR